MGGTLYYGAFTCLLFFFLQYFFEYLQLSGRERQLCSVGAFSMTGLLLLLTLASPWTGAAFTVDEDGLQMGPWFPLLQSVVLLCYLFVTIVILRHRSVLRRREFVFLLLYILIPLAGGLSRIVLPNIVLVNAGFTVATLLILMNVQFEHEVMLKEQEKQLAEGRIDIMLSQIQPHFLYNSLGVIYSLCATDPEAARKAIKRFSDFLRGNMDSLKNREPIPFEAELNHVMNYLYLEQQRFGDKLQVIYQIKTEDFLIPPLTLQPLVENAVQHGVLHRKNGGTVVIRTEETDAGALVTIEDNGGGHGKGQGARNLGEHSHIGISNVRSRLEEMVGGRLTLESNSLGTTATILIPWKRGTKPMNFLLTDDEPLQLQELTSILRRIRPEAQVFAYAWPDDALEGAKSNPIDVAFLDIQTGGMSGLELALELKRLQPGVHIIFVTGFSQYAVDAFAMHASGYLLKPATEEAVLRELTFLYQEREAGARCG